MYLSDKHRVELSYLGMIVLTVILGGLETRSKTLEDAAANAAKEYLQGLDAAKKNKLYNRTYRLLDKTIRKNEGESGEKIIFAVYHFLERLIASGYIEMPADSDLARVVDHLLAVPDLDKDYTQARLKKAEKTAKIWLEELNKDGYFVINGKNNED